MNFIRLNDTHKKKQKSFFATVLVEGVEDGQLPVISGDHQLVNLPPDCLILGGEIFVKTASDAVTSATGTLGTTEGGSEIVSAADLKVAGSQGTFAGASLTDTGKTVWLGVTKAGGDGTAVAEYIVRVDYLEYTKKTGEFTSFS